MRLHKPLTLLFIAWMTSLSILRAQVPEPWSSSTTYVEDDQVILNGVSFRAKASSTGEQPDPDAETAFWISLDLEADSLPDPDSPPSETPDPDDVGGLDAPGSPDDSDSGSGSGSSSSTRLVNISTRGYVGTGNDVLIAGFVIKGDSTATKRCMVAVTGASLTAAPGFSPLQNPTMELHQAGVGLLATNDNWDDNSQSDIDIFQKWAPSSTNDPVILKDLGPGSYTAIVRGVGNTQGIAIVGVNDMEQDGGTGSAYIFNISTRGKVGTGNNVMIAGFVVKGDDANSLKVIVSNTAASLGDAPGFTTLKNPMIELYDGQTRIDYNDNWQERSSDEISVLGSSGVTPKDQYESSMVKDFAPKAYTAIMSGVGNTQGNAVIGVTLAE